MTKGKVVVVPGQAPRDAELMDIEESKEEWSSYRLADGSTIRVKQVAMEIWRVDGMYDPEGNPQYVVKSAGIMNVNSPDHLKKKLN